MPQQCHEPPVRSESGHDALPGDPLGGHFPQPALGRLGPLQDRGVERLTVAQSASLGLCEGEPLEAAPGHLLQRDGGGSARVRGDGVGLDLLGQLDQGAGLTDVEGADPGAPQRVTAPDSVTATAATAAARG